MTPVKDDLDSVMACYMSTSRLSNEHVGMVEGAKHEKAQAALDVWFRCVGASLSLKDGRL